MRRSAPTHLSRLAADLARWTDPALGWAELDEAYTTGSSIMPQKRNPDTAELARAKAARIAAGFAWLTSVLHGLPLGYHRDLQEDKEPAFDAADTLELVLPALVGAVETVRFDAGAMRAAASDEGLYATDVAEALVRGGVPFREAHRRTGELLKQLAAGRVRCAISPPPSGRRSAWPTGRRCLDADASVRARSGAGGPSPASVVGQADAIEVWLGSALGAHDAGGSGAGRSSTRARGTVTVNVVPTSGVLCTSTVPPIEPSRPATMWSPSPTPP